MAETSSGHLNQSDVSAPAALLTNKEKYRELKKRFKFLVYENEFYQEELRNLQRKLMKLSRDRNFLLDRLLMFQRPSDSSDESDSAVPKKVKRTRTRKRDPKATGTVLAANCRKARKSSTRDTAAELPNVGKEDVSESQKELTLPNPNTLPPTQSLVSSEQ
ncbi:hypothetical protein M514_06132 [Trichuris suis]|uniref:INO80 complex subunit E N-terminal domain-containing protein n=1 Tax=Trichuris suis TaxID=68888 RepID=A0A085M720_9BILA|nr:hypothetical protein M513_06132 [Trichuris suis]KFD69850.1 hypothetical protein M514_06132 [Trichuris suis]KHJ44814.1 hypothetical protein D918_05067 [Trichuris suis]